VDRKEVIEVITDKGEYTQNASLRYWFYDIPNKLNTKGEQLPKVTYNDDPHLYAFQKQLLVPAQRGGCCFEIYRKGV
jgi:hypothetical protein